MLSPSSGVKSVSVGVGGGRGVSVEVEVVVARASFVGAVVEEGVAVGGWAGRQDMSDMPINNVVTQSLERMSLKE